MTKTGLICGVIWIAAGSVPCALVAADKVDLNVVNQIRNEEFQNSKVMEHLRYLSDLYGPRLTASPEFKEAADWALGRLKEYGLENVHAEKSPWR